jgi:hypothetical protein
MNNFNLGRIVFKIVCLEDGKWQVIAYKNAIKRLVSTETDDSKRFLMEGKLDNIRWIIANYLEIENYLNEIRAKLVTAEKNQDNDEAERLLSLASTIMKIREAHYCVPFSELILMTTQPHENKNPVIEPTIKEPSGRCLN